VSIGVAYKEQVVVGLVYNPVLEDMYTAIRGKGAFCNGVAIKVAEGEISEAVINCGCTYARLLNAILLTSKTVLSDDLHIL
jgi:myo-inositol-1(or 4)-monophosphatase